MSETVNIQLKHPIDFGSQRIESLTMRPLKAKDLRRVKSSTDQQVAYALELACYMTGQVEQVIDELEGEDIGAVIEAVTGFLSSSLMTGDE